MATTRTVTAVEQAPFASATVDREAGHIDGVLICGTTSRNGRDYPPAVLARDYARYEGAAVNADHADAATADRRLGWFSNVKPGPDGRPRGRLNLLKSHPLADRVFEAAERNPALFGMSHVAVCSTKRINGREAVESINKVLSIDLVADPATTTSLYESFHPWRPPVKLKAYCEAIAAKFPAAKPRLLKWLREDFPPDPDMPDDAPPVDAAPTADDPVKAAFSQAMHALVDQMDAGEIDAQTLISKLKTLMKAAEKMAGGGGDATPEPDGDESAESLKAKLADAIKETAALKLTALIGDARLTDVQRKAVAALTDDADRKALVESFKQAAQGQRPKSGEQNAERAGSTPAGKIPTDGKAFAESVRRTK